MFNVHCYFKKAYLNVPFIQVGTQTNTDTKTEKAILQLKPEISQQMVCIINE